MLGAEAGQAMAAVMGLVRGRPLAASDFQYDDAEALLGHLQVGPLLQASTLWLPPLQDLNL